MDLSVAALGLILSELTLSLFQLHLEGARVYLGEEITLFNELAFLEGNTDELTIHAAADRDGIKGGHAPETIEINGDVTALSGGHNHGNHEIASTRTTLGCRCRGTGILRLAGGPDAVEVPNSGENHTDYKNPKPRVALGLRGARA